ncbi:MAG: TPM domain-containing protein [Polaribacter sp.]
MKITNFFVILLLIVCSCKQGKKIEVSFNNEINRYNYLDKPHKLKFVYDFQKIFTKKESKLLYDKLFKLNQMKKFTFIIISDKKSLKQDFTQSTKMTNGIFKEKYALNKVMTLKVNKISRELAIAYSNSISNKINDSICNIIIEKILKPNFRNKKYYDGINISIDSIINYIK